MVRSVLARVTAFVKWLLAPEKLDCIPEHGLDRARPYYGPIYGRNSNFLAWLLSWEAVPVEDPVEASSSARPTFMSWEEIPVVCPAGASSSTRPTFLAYLFSRESLPQTQIFGVQRPGSSKRRGRRCHDPVEAEDPKPEPPTSKGKN